MSLTWGAFPFCQTNQLETSGIINRKWNDIFQLKQSFQPKFLLLLSKVGLETRIFGNETASFGRSGPTGQRHMTCKSSQMECPEMRLWEEDRNAPIRDIKFEAHVS